MDVTVGDVLRALAHEAVALDVSAKASTSVVQWHTFVGLPPGEPSRRVPATGTPRLRPMPVPDSAGGEERGGRGAGCSVPPRPDQRLSLTLLGTAGSPVSAAGRYATSSALVVNGRTYLIDYGRCSLSRFVQAGLSLPSLAGILLTHPHVDHTVDYFTYPLLAAGIPAPDGFTNPIDVYGPHRAACPHRAPAT